MLQGDTTPRPALPTFLGDTGLWFVPTAETLPAHKWSASLLYDQVTRPQGLTNSQNIKFTAAYGIGDRAEVFGSWGIVRYDRDAVPFFNANDPAYLGVDVNYPFLHSGWSKNLGTPIYIGVKYSLISQSRGDAFSIAPRVTVKIPNGVTQVSTDAADVRADLVASREFNKQVELSTFAGVIKRKDSDQFSEPNSIPWGVGATFPSRAKLRGLVEWSGEWLTKPYITAHVPVVADDGSVSPIDSEAHQISTFSLGAVYQMTDGLFVHGGFNFTQGAADRPIGSSEAQNGWGFDVRVGWHPGVTPPRQRVRQIKETTTVTNTVTPAPAPAPNRNPTFSATATCDPTTVEPGQTSRCTATATDPDGDAVTYQWTAPSGTFNPADAASTTWTAPQQLGNVPVTVTARDSRGGSATSSVTLQVVRREVITFEDVHFQFDRYNLRPDALMILDAAVTKLMANPNIRVTIEGHCDSIGTSEYNLALGERRANSVRDYLVSRGIGQDRMRTVSYGEDRPIADNKTAEGRAMNRRAHLVVIMETVQ
ncbi:MAG TPA: OmpA family protein [Vicinamibacterales bacterium]|nr:OmpA family protein [Vicinamibacterales bacterium]